MARRLALATILVRDYDEALAFYVGTLGFALIEDTVMSAEKRWVVVSPGEGASLLLARASDEKQSAQVGRQAGGRVGFFLETDDIARDLSGWRAKGVTVLREPAQQAYGTVAVFADLYGNKWDLIQPN